VQYRKNQELLYEQPAALPEDWQPNAPRVRTLIGEVRKAERTLLTEYEAKELLGCYGIPTVPTVNARTADDAVIEARRLGFPVVLKLWSEVITHKTDAGGVMLNIADDDAVPRRVWPHQRECAILLACAHKSPGGRGSCRAAARK